MSLEIVVVVIIIHLVVTIRLRLCGSFSKVNRFPTSSSTSNDITSRDWLQVVVATFLFFLIVYYSLTKKRWNYFCLSRKADNIRVLSSGYFTFGGLETRHELAVR